MDLNPEHTRSIFYVSLAGIGGALGYIYRETRAGRTIRFTRVLLSALLAAFIGFHMILIYSEFGLSEPMIGALNGLTSILGVEFSLYLFERIVFRHLGISSDDRIKQALINAGWTPPSNGAGTPSMESDK